MSAFDGDIGDRTTVTMGIESDDRERIPGEVVEVERGHPTEEFPVSGETVTFKSVGGQVEKTVETVDRDRDRPIKLVNGGWYVRTDLVEYTEMRTHTIFKADDGREIWPAEESDE